MDVACLAALLCFQLGSANLTESCQVLIEFPTMSLTTYISLMFQ
ncbi:hypothetical protein L293_1594 [Acinetobacter gyllenbergii CIP 110306 = MTCC 11365]|nr:hypothetical protein L293_1594 [Acinetobacter gyllenbergii CIP 110306 = MTCC 11365]